MRKFQIGKAVTSFLWRGSVQVNQPTKEKVMAQKPIKPPPPPVGDEVFFQIPELEQLPTGNYKQVGDCKITVRDNVFRFYILKYRKKLMAAHTLRQLPLWSRLKLSGGSLLPFEGTAQLTLVPTQRLPTGDYRLAGSGKVKLQKEIDPSKIYILEKVIRFRDGRVFPDNRQFVAISIEQRDLRIPTGSLLEVMRKGRVMTLGVDRRTAGMDESSFLNEEMVPAERSIYVWFGTSFVPVHHFMPQYGT